MLCPGKVLEIFVTKAVKGEPRYEPWSSQCVDPSALELGVVVQPDGVTASAGAAPLIKAKRPGLLNCEPVWPSGKALGW